MASALGWLEPVALAALRVVAGFVFWAHGVQKLFGLFGGSEVPLASRLGAAGVIETVAGSLIMVGLWTVPAAFISIGEMAFAYFLAHAPRGRWPILNGGEVAVLLCFIFLFFAARGGGRFSVDSLLGRSWFRR
jgi:putative oxidoreductase